MIYGKDKKRKSRNYKKVQTRAELYRLCPFIIWSLNRAFVLLLKR